MLRRSPAEIVLHQHCHHAVVLPEIIYYFAPLAGSRRRGRHRAERVLNAEEPDTSILHHAFISIFIALWAVITRYVTILMPILSILQGLHEEGECRQLEFSAGKGANIIDLFCTAPKVLKLHGSYFQNI